MLVSRALPLAAIATLALLGAACGESPDPERPAPAGEDSDDAGPTPFVLFLDQGDSAALRVTPPEGSRPFQRLELWSEGTRLLERELEPAAFWIVPLEQPVPRPLEVRLVAADGRRASRTVHE